MDDTKEYKEFLKWAGNTGYDTSSCYSDRICNWIFFNPMTADLWHCWQARAKLMLTLPVKDATGEH